MKSAMDARCGTGQLGTTRLVFTEEKPSLSLFSVMQEYVYQGWDFETEA